MATPAKLCKKALADATVRWPNRSKVSDGIMGDARHKARKSDHNDGNAFDLTHDPDNGVDCSVLAQLVADSKDGRVTYIIWNRRIFKMSSPGWRKYTGTNPHTKHMHVSIKSSARDSIAPWPWSLNEKLAELPASPKDIKVTIDKPKPPAPPDPSTDPPKHNAEEKGLTTEAEPDAAGTPPPAPAVEIKPSSPSLFNKLSTLSIPASVMTALAAVGQFVQNIPPWVWGVAVGIALLVTAYLWNEHQKRAHQRTLRLMDAGADKDQNNLRLVSNLSKEDER